MRGAAAVGIMGLGGGRHLQGAFAAAHCCRRQQAHHDSEPAFDDRRRDHALPGRHYLQQLLRVWSVEERPVTQRRVHEDKPLDGDRRSPGEEKKDCRHLEPVEVPGAGGAGLPAPLRGGLEHNVPLGSLFALRVHQLGRSDALGEIRFD